MEFKDNIFLKAALTGEIESPSGLSTQSLNNASKQKASNWNKPSTNTASWKIWLSSKQWKFNEKARLESSVDIYKAKLWVPWEGWWILPNMWGRGQRNAGPPSKKGFLAPQQRQGKVSMLRYFKMHVILQIFSYYFLIWEKNDMFAEASLHRRFLCSFCRVFYQRFLSLPSFKHVWNLMTRCGKICAQVAHRLWTLI